MGLGQQRMSEVAEERACVQHTVGGRPGFQDSFPGCLDCLDWDAAKPWCLSSGGCLET